MFEIWKAAFGTTGIFAVASFLMWLIYKEIIRSDRLSPQAQYKILRLMIIMTVFFACVTAVAYVTMNNPQIIGEIARFPYTVYCFVFLLLVILFLVAMITNPRPGQATKWIFGCLTLLLIITLLLIAWSWYVYQTGQKKAAELGVRLENTPTGRKMLEPLDLGLAGQETAKGIKLSPEATIQLVEFRRDAEFYSGAGIESMALYSGRLAYYAGDIERAETLFNAALKVEESPLLLNDLGVVAYRNKQLDEADRLFRRALELKPDFPNAMNDLGLIFYSRGQVNEAIEQFNMALKIKPDYGNALNNRGLAYYDLGRKTDNPKERNRFFEKSEQDLKAAEKILADSSAVSLNLGLLYDHWRKLPDAIRYYENATRNDPSDPKPYNNLAMIFSENADFLDGRTAVEMGEKAVSFAPGNFGYLDTLARAYLADGQCKKAIETAEKALAGAQTQSAPFVKDTEALVRRIKEKCGEPR